MADMNNNTLYELEDISRSRASFPFKFSPNENNTTGNDLSQKHYWKLTKKG